MKNGNLGATLTRRAVLMNIATAAGALALLPPTGVVDIFRRWNPELRDLRQLSHRDFDLLVGGTVEATDGQRRIPVRLNRVSTERRFEGGGQRYRTYSLFFEGPINEPLEGGLHRVTHQELGAIDLFLQPVGPTKDARLYEAVICQTA